MILFRYLVREVLLTLTAVSAVLLLIILGGRFIGLFQDVAEGSLSLDFLWTLLLLQFPSVLELILPLGFFLSVMLTYGRLYQENEIGVLLACGFSPNRLLAYTLITGLFVAAIVASFSLWLTPLSESKTAQILDEQKQRVDFSTIQPGRFQSFSGGQVVYTEDLKDSNTKMHNVFLSQQIKGEDGKVRTAVFKAELGYQYLDEKTGSRYLVLEDGARTEGRAGQRDFSILTFERYAVRMSEKKKSAASLKVRQLPSTVVFSSDNPAHQAATQWRLSLPIMVLVVTLIAVPLSYVRPRQGRFAKLFPAVFLHIFYLSALISVQGMIEKGRLDPSVGLWSVHAVFLSIAVYLLFKEPLINGLKAIKRERGSV
ncbi:LPS export ABC transporter permease LptF [Oceanospirillum sanctuarii]|uniref:LPS export ABC transporter permease LptF n=1 Tax=Oceanospirillum sanctuarii TaxID=1434821 RepID=UPI0015940B9B|nr:LPS export ABC transporter permease LptF [Oceanospirillum sanctuarii]